MGQSWIEINCSVFRAHYHVQSAVPMKVQGYSASNVVRYLKYETDLILFRTHIHFIWSRT